MTASSKMSPEQIKEAIELQRKQIKINSDFIMLRENSNTRCYKEIVELQGQCPHPTHYVGEAVGIGGNVDVKICSFCGTNLGSAHL